MATKKNHKKTTQSTSVETTYQRAIAGAHKSLTLLGLNTLIAVFKIISALYLAEKTYQQAKQGTEFNEGEFWQDTAVCSKVLKVARSRYNGKTTKTGKPVMESYWLFAQLVSLVTPLFRCGIRTLDLMKSAVERIGVQANPVVVADIAKSQQVNFSLVRNLSRCGLIENDKRVRETYFRLIVSLFATSDNGPVATRNAILRKASGNDNLSHDDCEIIKKAIDTWLQRARAAATAKKPAPASLTWVNALAPMTEVKQNVA